MNATACPQCVRLRHELDTANEQVRQLKAQAVGGFDVVARLVSRVGLTGSEAIILAVILSKDVARRQAVMGALYSDDPNGGADPKGVEVMLLRIHRKVAPLAVKIFTVRGIGWSMDADSKAKVRAALGLAQ